ncbi:TPA: hypothetical protein RJS82_003272 [Pseudomonas aeruginosa]|nr:hypothetical protein [Pseudomonas aeruginosa]HDV6574900.1 hypothetical protein [Pseudomonas aeruginosa]
MREEFEAWLLREHGLESEWQEERNCFKDYPAHLAFKAWQASRAALRVELPPSVTIEEVAEHLGMDDVDVVDIAHMVNGAIAACAAFIKQAGIEVKHGTA